MTLSFGHIVFSQLRYLVTNLTKKNYKATVTEITQVWVRSVLGHRRMIGARFRTRAQVGIGLVRSDCDSDGRWFVLSTPHFRDASIACAAQILDAYGFEAYQFFIRCLTETTEFKDHKGNQRDQPKLQLLEQVPPLLSIFPVSPTQVFASHTKSEQQ